MARNQRARIEEDWTPWRYLFDLTSEQKILRDSVRAFAEKEIRPQAHELDRNERFSVEITRKMAEMGLFGMSSPATGRAISASSPVSYP
jgi:alkylation response protein AidB-like acyl-CoA dehydrogenase